MHTRPDLARSYDPADVEPRLIAREDARLDIGRIVGAGEGQAGAAVERRASPAR